MSATLHCVFSLSCSIYLTSDLQTNSSLTSHTPPTRAYTHLCTFTYKHITHVQTFTPLHAHIFRYNRSNPDPSSDLFLFWAITNHICPIQSVWLIMRLATGLQSDDQSIVALSTHTHPHTHAPSPSHSGACGEIFPHRRTQCDSTINWPFIKVSPQYMPAQRDSITHTHTHTLRLKK